MSNDLSYLIIGIFILLCIIYTILKRKRNIKLLQGSISKRWGKVPEIQCGNGELTDISRYYYNLSDINTNTFFIDNITWNDLDMDSVFKRLNNTQSSVGEEFLYALLREPVSDEQILKERHRLIEYFSQNADVRLKFQVILAGMGKTRFIGISNYFFNNEKYISFKSRIYSILSIGLLISPLASIINPMTGFLCMAIMFAVNALVYYKTKNMIESYLEGYGCIVHLIKTSKKIADADIEGIHDYAKRLKELSGKIRSLTINSFYPFFYKTNDWFLEPLKVLFLVELIAFERLSKVISKHKIEIRNLYETIGLLDSMISIASYRETLESYTVPSLYKYTVSGYPTLFFKDAFHPLLNNPVSNSINLEKPILITGSNASGKSTFLKTIAINAIFAQTIYTCLAREYKSSYYRIFSSMELREDMANNESYYTAEIKSLKRVIDNLKNDDPVLCVIDEVLRGTNTIERIAASSEVLISLCRKNCMCIAATHDIELASILYSQFDNYHFQESFNDNKILFEYRIYPGKATTRNAIKLLKILGFEDITVKAAEERANRFMREGKWCHD
jgi:hypothetical protein